MAGTIYQHRDMRVQAEVAQKVVRFHVRANSESASDQNVKMLVKKEVLAYLQPLLEDMGTVDDTRRFLQGSLDSIRQVSRQTLREQGYSYDVSVSLQEEMFPLRTYGDCAFPAGRYLALVIELGSGEGQNWWCMLYPGLCFVDESYGIVSEEKKEELKGVLSEDAYDWIVEPEHRKITVRWGWMRKVLEFAL